MPEYGQGQSGWGDVASSSHWPPPLERGITGHSRATAKVGFPWEGSGGHPWGVPRALSRCHGSRLPLILALLTGAGVTSAECLRASPHLISWGSEPGLRGQGAPARSGGNRGGEGSLRVD